MNSQARRQVREPLGRSLVLAAVAGAMLGGVVVAVQLLGRDDPAPPTVTLPATVPSTVPGNGLVIGPGSGELENAAVEFLACVNTELVRNGGVSYIESGRTEEAAYQELFQEAQITCARSR
jgi:hypothetical protein